MADALDELIHRADLDALVRYVDDTCSARDWDHLVRVRNEARAAVNSGRQLWPIATLANYRLALWAPAEQAVRALDDTARTFMPGPVSEILAVHHSWEELEPHLAPGHDRSLVAYERSIRRDVIEQDEPTLLDIPYDILSWEPQYAIATYTDNGVESPEPFLNVQWEPLITREGSPMSDNTVHVFRQMMESWTAHSNGSARAAVVEGELPEALYALGGINCEVSSITSQEALASVAWASASGGAHGKRKGAATGRSDAWWLMATFTGLDDAWLCDSDELGEILDELQFFTFAHEKTPTTGWNLSLAIVDPEEGLAVAMEASDHD